MKSLHIFLLMLCISLLPLQILAQESVINDTLPISTLPRIMFQVQEYNFGNIKLGESISYHFEYSNTGKQPLRILAVQTSCDCTTAIWDKKPIAQGEKAKITVIYTPKPNQLGDQRKVILVISNAQNKEERIYMKGSVSKD
ncbi:MAG: hypothetical protein OHK0045_04220 [Raineya sp.]